MDRGISRDVVITDSDRGREPVPDTRLHRDRGRPERLPRRERPVRLSDTEREMLLDVGRFRTVAVADLVRGRYRGDRAKLHQDLKSLTAQGLVRRRTATLRKGRGTLEVVVLTKPGKTLSERVRPDDNQAVYAGFVKPSEVAHDAAIYRMYHKEAAHLEQQGNRITRVVLDYEFKRRIYSPLAKVKHLPPVEYAQRQAEVAREAGLKVVRGKIPLPDLRIEYETAQGERAHVDLELTTDHYHGSHLRTKVDAGFKLYAEAGSAHTRVPEERELTTEILSF